MALLTLGADMARPSIPGGKPTKQRRKRSTPKRRNAPKAVRNRGVSIAGQETVVARLTQERDEALLRETANAEILRLIAKSSGDLELLFRTILENATRICNANFGTLFRFDGKNFHPVAQFNTPAKLLEAQTRRGPFQPSPGTAIEHVMRTKQVSHSADRAAEPVPGFFAAHGGARSQVVVPMLKDDALIGAIAIYRQEVRPFTDKQIELLKNFANQAVIAIENTRLFNETGEALARQTATADVLKVIASSPSTLQPVFDAIAERSKALIGAHSTVVVRYIDGMIQLASFTPVSPEADATVRKMFPRRPTAGDPPEQILRGEIAQITDAESDSEISPMMRDAARARGWRSRLVVPLKDDSGTIGWISITRKEPGGFADKDVELLCTFADQAVIAIQNVKLFEEVQARTRDLEESLHQQTATSEVLQIISSSPGELAVVFDKILENATRVCGAEFGSMYLVEGDSLSQAALYNVPAALAAARANRVFRPYPQGPMADAMRTKQAVQVADVRTTPAYLERAPNAVELAELGGARTLVFVPMLREGEVVGAITIYRQEVRPFADKHIELVSNFAKQAVIAIENARLLTETREALERQTATSEVLKVISSSPGELNPVFETMLAYAVRICEAKFGTLFLCEGDDFRVVAEHNTPPALAELHQREPIIRVGPSTSLYRSKKAKQPIQIADLTAEPAYFERDPNRVALVELGGYCGVLSVPMVKEGEVIGAINMYRQDAGTFSDNHVDLVKNFAAQAVIAIENARLLNELRESYRLVQEQASKLETQSQELVKLNQQLEHRVADQVGEIERMGRLRRFLPPQVADLIIASGTEKQLESHRREITALFCDLRGFTGFSEASAPEDVMALLRDYHGAIGKIIIKYSGTLERYAGDGVMVVFNDPVPVDNPAHRAVLMALETREAMGALMEKWHQLGHDVGFGIGIAHGFATLGTIGFEGRFDYAAIGTVSNLASRLCDEAKPGQILISPRVFTAVKDAVMVKPVGEFTLKGIGRPLAAYNVLGAKPAN
jgi:two-component system, NtrC family, sensor kinase